MPHTQGDRSFAHIEHPYLDDDQGDHYYEYEELAYDIHVEHEHESPYMPTEPADTSVLQWQDRHRSDDVFIGIVSIFNFNIHLI